MRKNVYEAPEAQVLLLGTERILEDSNEGNEGGIPGVGGGVIVTPEDEF